MKPSRLLARNPDLLLCWEDGRLLAKNLENGRAIFATPEVVALLDAYGHPRSTTRREDTALVGRLEKLGFLRCADRSAKSSLLRDWNHNLASAHYHAATRNVRFLRSRAAIEAFLRARMAEGQPPSLFKRYQKAPRVRLPKAGRRATVSPPLREVLRRRRTVREFSTRPVAIEVFSEIMRGTWGQTGWLEAEILGRLILKTSPSAGALHPVECYALVWNVEGVRPGLYHYDVRADELRRLRAGDLRSAAIEVASGQRWVGRAAFLCMMTVVFKRTLWKYRIENSYQVVWLDAGHLGQTFSLLATSFGLGSFTTAAVQRPYTEKLIGLDGIKEFPVYLCGAGVPAKKLL